MRQAQELTWKERSSEQLVCWEINSEQSPLYSLLQGSVLFPLKSVRIGLNLFGFYVE